MTKLNTKGSLITAQAFVRKMIDSSYVSTVYCDYQQNPIKKVSESGMPDSIESSSDAVYYVEENLWNKYSSIW